MLWKSAVVEQPTLIDASSATMRLVNAESCERIGGVRWRRRYWPDCMLADLWPEKFGPRRREKMGRKRNENGEGQQGQTKPFLERIDAERHACRRATLAAQRRHSLAVGVSPPIAFNERPTLLLGFAAANPRRRSGKPCIRGLTPPG
jgi:hypothetical protein